MSGMPWFAADERVPDARDLRPALLTQTVLDAWYQRRGFVMHRSSLGVIEFWYPRAPTTPNHPLQQTRRKWRAAERERRTGHHLGTKRPISQATNCTCGVRDGVEVR